MSATTPLWATVLLAVLAPFLTLLGVWLTQRASDRRAVREAELRLEAQREQHLADRRFEVYSQVLQTIDDIYGHLRDKRSAVSMEWISSGMFTREFDADGWRSAVARFSGLTNQLMIVGNRDAVVAAHKADVALGGLTREAMNEKQVRLVFTWEILRDFIRGRRDLIRAIRKDWGTADELSDTEISYYGPKL